MIFPGDVVAAVSDYLAGNNLYNDGHHLISTVFGTSAIHGNTISVTPAFPSPTLNPGSLLLGLVSKIREEKAELELLQVDGEKVPPGFYFDILKEHVRKDMVDQVCMQLCFLPGDVVIARYLSQGDGRRIYGSCGEKGLGVKYGRGEYGLLLGINEEEMQCTVTGQKYARKACCE